MAEPMSCRQKDQLQQQNQQDVALLSQQAEQAVSDHGKLRSRVLGLEDMIAQLQQKCQDYETARVSRESELHQAHKLFKITCRYVRHRAFILAITAADCVCPVYDRLQASATSNQHIPNRCAHLSGFQTLWAGPMGIIMHPNQPTVRACRYLYMLKHVAWLCTK